MHLPAGRGGQRADEEVAERRAGVRAAALPLADDIIAFGDQVGGGAELQVRKRGAEIGLDDGVTALTQLGLLKAV